MSMESQPGRRWEGENHEQDPQRALALMTREALQDIRHNEVLTKVEQAELSPEQWRIFAEQRYLAALPFTSLLKAGVESAQDEVYDDLAQTLHANLNDELGVKVTDDGTEIQDEVLSHETWRRDFYEALGITQEQLEALKQDDSHWLEGTRNYKRTLDEIIEEGDSLTIAGAVLALEHTIPHEFSKIKKGRDATFPENFVTIPEDDSPTRERKEKARLYIDDHISHDAASHYPDLLNALARHVSDPAKAARIQKGVDAIKGAKEEFYKSLKPAIG